MTPTENNPAARTPRKRFGSARKRSCVATNASALPISGTSTRKSTGIMRALKISGSNSRRWRGKATGPSRRCGEWRRSATHRLEAGFKSAGVHPFNRNWCADNEHKLILSDALRKDRAPSVGVDGKNAELWHTIVAEFSLTERHMVMDEVANSSVLAGLSLEVDLTKHWGPAATSRTFEASGAESQDCRKGGSCSRGRGKEDGQAAG